MTTHESDEDTFEARKNVRWTVVGVAPRYRRDLVVAGVDSSACALHAAWWAAAEASRRHGALRVILGYEPMCRN